MGDTVAELGALVDYVKEAELTRLVECVTDERVGELTELRELMEKGEHPEGVPYPTDYITKSGKTMWYVTKNGRAIRWGAGGSDPKHPPLKGGEKGPKKKGGAKAPQTRGPAGEKQSYTQIQKLQQQNAFQAGQLHQVAQQMQFTPPPRHNVPYEAPGPYGGMVRGYRPQSDEEYARSVEAAQAEHQAKVAMGAEVLTGKQQKMRELTNTLLYTNRLGENFSYEVQREVGVKPSEASTTARVLAAADLVIGGVLRRLGSAWSGVPWSSLIYTVGTNLNNPRAMVNVASDIVVTNSEHLVRATEPTFTAKDVVPPKKVNPLAKMGQGHEAIEYQDPAEGLAALVEQLLEGEHKIGDKWQGPSGRWTTLNDQGKAVPAEGPGKKDGGSEPKGKVGMVGVKPFRTTDELLGFAERYFKHGKNAKYSSSEEKSLNRYTFNGFLVMNQLLRKPNLLPWVPKKNEEGKWVHDEEGSKVAVKQARLDITALDSILARTKLPEDVIVYRGLKVSPDILNALKPGMVFRDKGFVSTSLYRRIAMGHFVKNAVMVIKVPNGFKGILTETYERELILPRRTKFKVVKVKTTTKNNHVIPEIHMEVIP